MWCTYISNGIFSYNIHTSFRPWHVEMHFSCRLSCAALKYEYVDASKWAFTAAPRRWRRLSFWWRHRAMSVNFVYESDCVLTKFSSLSRILGSISLGNQYSGLSGRSERSRNQATARQWLQHVTPHLGSMKTPLFPFVDSYVRALN